MTDFPALAFASAPGAPDTINAVVYGPPGAGKSTLAATAPGPVLWINFEGPGALAYARKTAAANGTEVREVQVAHDQDPRPILRAAVAYVRSGEGVQTVVIDTIGKMRDGLARAIGGKQPTIAQWGEIGRTIEDVVRVLRDEPVNLVLIAHEEIKDSDDGDRIVRPQIGGATTEKVIADVDVVAYLGVKRDEEGVQYLASFVEARGRRAKDRSGGLGTVQPSDFGVWLDAYRAALTPDDSDLPFSATEKGETLDDAIVSGEIETEAKAT